eukprot:2905541-Rhodomonas_salina.1
MLFVNASLMTCLIVVYPMLDQPYTQKRQGDCEGCTEGARAKQQGGYRTLQVLVPHAHVEVQGVSIREH